MNFIKRNKKSIIVIGVSVLLAALVCSFLGGISEGFINWEDASLRKRNEDNLLTGEFTDFNDGNGVSATGRKDGSILLNGKNRSEAPITIPVETVNLVAGTYTISGAKNGGNSTYHIAVKYTDGDGAVQTAVSDFNNKTFTITSGQNVEVSIVIHSDVKVDGVLIKPVLVSGKDIGEFYA